MTIIRNGCTITVSKIFAVEMCMIYIFTLIEWAKITCKYAN